jgi:hypothetical protein
MTNLGNQCAGHPLETKPCGRCRELHRARRESLKSQGLCPSCGKRPLEKERRSCAVCLRYYADKAARNQVKRRDEGRCVTSGCHAMAASGHMMCDTHLKYMIKASGKRRRQQIRDAVCIQSCGRRVEFPPRRLCLTCETKRRERHGLTGIPPYVRKLIRQGFAKHRRIESQRFLLRYLNLVSPREQGVLRIVYDLGFLGGAKRSLTYAGKEMGFTRERARQIHDKAMLRIFAVPEELPRNLVSIKARLDKYPQWLNQRLKARQLAEHAISAGKIPKQPCKECGEAKAEAHHPDYSQPLLVEWLCRPCHNKEHHGEKAA